MVDHRETVDVIIVNWNSSKLVNNLLRDLFENKCFIEYVKKIIVIDNSQNFELKFFELSDKLCLLKPKENLGFGRACNLGTVYSDAKYILFLNPDISFRTFDARKFFEIIYEAPPLYKIFGIKLVNENGDINRDCSRFPNLTHFIFRSSGLSLINKHLFKSYLMDEWDHNSSREVDHVIGAFYFLERDLFVTLNGFDENFFLYYEDLDFSKRTETLGYKSFYISEVCATHIQGGTTVNIKCDRLYMSNLSKIKYVSKHFTVMAKIIGFFFLLVVEPLVRITHAIIKFNFGSLSQIFCSYWKLYFNISTKFYRRWV